MSGCTSNRGARPLSYLGCMLTIRIPRGRLASESEAQLAEWIAALSMHVAHVDEELMPDDLRHGLGDGSSRCCSDRFTRIHPLCDRHVPSHVMRSGNKGRRSGFDYEGAARAYQGTQRRDLPRAEVIDE